MMITGPFEVDSDVMSMNVSCDEWRAGFWNWDRLSTATEEGNGKSGRSKDR